MRSKKVITLLISLMLLVSIALPGTLAVAIDQEVASSSVMLTSGEQETPTPAPEEQEDQNEPVAPVNPEAPTEPENTCTCGTTDDTHKEGCTLYVAPEAPAEPENTCTCGSADGTHREGCPLYEAPVCTCDPKPAEGEAHQEGCPLYVEQIESPEEVEIKYQVVGPENCGTLDRESECLPLPIIGTESGSDGESPSAASDDLHLSGDSVAAIGAAPTAAKGFKFVGWYKDEACTQPVDASWVSGNKLIPGMTKNYGTEEAPVMGYEAATYYAKFEYDVADLTITKQGCQDIDEGQSFIFDVTGWNGYRKRVVINDSSSVTIKGLMVGEYTVKEVIGWSGSTVGSSPKIITLQPAASNTVDFSSTQNEQKWLRGDAYKKITFGN